MSKGSGSCGVPHGGIGDLSCEYSSGVQRSGNYSDAFDLMSFPNESLPLSAGSNSACPPLGTFSGTLGPVTDSSVAGSPPVFVS
jgi:hypothetical protein